MKYLKELTSCVEVIGSNVTKDIPVEGLSVRSDKVQKNYLFFVTGEGEKYMEEAVRNGACCIVAEKEYEGYPCLCVKDIRKTIASVSRAYYDYPDKNLKIVGVVGTNGKTSITHILRRIFTYAGFRTATIGTIGVYIGEEEYENGMTTPDSPDLFYYLREAADRKTDYVFLEITAHAIYYQKTEGIQCDICIFTNCTQDHLDFFDNMERYKDVKKGYFTPDHVKCAIVNSDDACGRQIANEGKICCIGYGITEPADVFAVAIEQHNGTDFVANVLDDILYLHSPLYGLFNVSNVLACITCGKLLGLDGETLTMAVSSLQEIEGRFNVINWKAKIIIDFAHTPDGLQKVLGCARDICDGKLFIVFGCGGNRDKSKRAKMGSIASLFGDECIITSDNPRTENPEEILDDIAIGIRQPYQRITDRKEAIRYALRKAEKGDVVLICGKGGEKYTEINNQKIPYDDKEFCLECIAESCYCPS